MYKYNVRKTVKTVLDKGSHPIGPTLGSSRTNIPVKKFFPRPGKKRNRLNEKIEVDPNEKVDHDSVSMTIRRLGINSGYLMIFWYFRDKRNDEINIQW